nr:hypothetical protein [Tanacetum cinerariifolium]
TAAAVSAAKQTLPSTAAAVSAAKQTLPSTVAAVSAAKQTLPLLLFGGGGVNGVEWKVWGRRVRESGVEDRIDRDQKSKSLVRLEKSKGKVVIKNLKFSGCHKPPQYTIDHQEDLNQQSMNDVDDRWNKIIEPRNKIIQILGEMVNKREQAAKLITHTPEPSRRFNYICYDDDDDYDYKESTIRLNDIISQEPASNVITTSPPVLPTGDPEDSLIIGNEDLITISEKESDEFIKSSVEDLIPIPSESKDTSRSESVCNLPSCDHFSPNDILEEKAVTFSLPSQTNRRLCRRRSFPHKQTDGSVAVVH